MTQPILVTEQATRPDRKQMGAILRAARQKVVDYRHNHPAPPPKPTPPPAPAPPPPAPVPAPKPGPTPQQIAKLAKSLTGPERNAYIITQVMLTEYGLQTLAPHVLKWVQQGYDTNAINFLLQQTKEYKQRFAGNELRQKAGLPVLSPGEYLATEAAYQQVLQAAGLPKSFYDSPDDYAGLIGANISPTEVQHRANMAGMFVQSTDPNIRSALKTMYGVDDAHLTAYFLDPSKAESILSRQAAAAQMGAAALDQGLHTPTVGDAERYLSQGYDATHAEADYATIAHMAPTLAGLGQVYNNPYDQGDAEQEVIGGLASARRKREQLTQDEVGSFSGSGGVNDTSLSQAATGTY